ncbi:hypothetical protein GKODMF_08875 [Candidatus Electrothrix gigas]
MPETYHGLICREHLIPAVVRASMDEGIGHPCQDGQIGNICKIKKAGYAAHSSVSWLFFLL